MTDKKFHHFLIFLAFALVFVGFIVLISFLHYKAQATDSTITVRLSGQHSAKFAGMYLANANETYDKENIKVNFRESNSTERDAVASVVANINDFAIVSPTELLDAVSKGEPVKAVAAIFQQSPTSIISLKQDNITKPANLKDKIIGSASLNDYSWLIYKQILLKNKVPSNSIAHKKTEFSPITDLVYGKVNAVAMSRLDAYVPKNGPLVELSFINPEDYGIQGYEDIIITSTKIIEENPQLVEKFISATVKGWEQVVDYPEEALTATLKYTHDEHANPELEKYILSASKLLIKPKNSVKIGGMTDSQWQEVYLIYNKSLVTQDFDVKKAYTLDFLP